MFKVVQFDDENGLFSGFDALSKGSVQCVWPAYF